MNALEESQQIRLRIAERLGWRVETRKTYTGQLEFWLMNPDGKGVGFVLLEDMDTEDEISTAYWMRIAREQADRLIALIPDYANDLDAALTLLPGDRWWVMFDETHIIVQIVRFNEMTGNQKILAHQKFKWDGYSVQAEALARCLAWLAYMDAKEVQP